MNRYEFEQAVMSSNLDAPSRHILQYYAYRKNWKTNGLAFPDYETISHDTGISLSTVKRKVALNREAGWLVDTGQRKGRGVIVYDLAIPTGVTVTPVDELSSVTVTPQSIDENEPDSSTGVTMTPQIGHSDPDRCHSDTSEVSPRPPNKKENKKVSKTENMSKGIQSEELPPVPFDLLETVPPLQEDQAVPAGITEEQIEAEVEDRALFGKHSSTYRAFKTEIIQAAVTLVTEGFTTNMDELMEEARRKGQW